MGNDAMKILINSIEFVNKIFVYLSAALMGLLSLIVFYEVCARYIFDSPTIWVNEISTYILQFIVFFTMGYLLIKDGHLKVTFFVDRLKGKASKVLRIVNNFLVIPYASTLLIYGWIVTSSAYERSSVSPTLLAIPMWIPSSFIFLGGGLLILGSICSILTIIFIEPNNQQNESKGGEAID